MQTGYDYIVSADIDECLEPGVCSQVCRNFKGGFKCECVRGYARDPHSHSRCKAMEGHASLLFAHFTDIRKISLDHQEVSECQVISAYLPLTVLIKSISDFLLNHYHLCIKTGQQTSSDQCKAWLQSLAGALISVINNLIFNLTIFLSSRYVFLRVSCSVIYVQCHIMIFHIIWITFLSFLFFTSQITAIVNETKGATALDFVFKTGMIFWTDAKDKRIYK